MEHSFNATFLLCEKKILTGSISAITKQTGTYLLKPYLVTMAALLEYPILET